MLEGFKHMFGGDESKEAVKASAPEHYSDADSQHSGVRAKEVTQDISTPQGDSVERGTVAVENTIEMETEEDIQHEPERRERIQQGLKMLWDRYAMKPGDMKNKGGQMISLLVKAHASGESLGLTEREGRLGSTLRIVNELANKMDETHTTQTEAENQKTRAGQIS